SSGTNGLITPGISGASAVTWKLFGFYSVQVPGHDSVNNPIDVVLVTSTGSNRVFVYQPQPPAPSDFRIPNGASFANLSSAPGSFVSVFAGTALNQMYKASTLPLPATLGGVTLNLGGSLGFDFVSGKWNYLPTGSTQAPLLFVGPSQVNFQI